MKAKLSSLVIALALLSTPVLASTAKPVGKVNGVSIPASSAEILAQEQIAQGAPDNEEMRRAVKDELVRREVVTQEARKRGIDKKAEVLARMEITRQGIIVGAYIQDWLQANPISEAQMRAEYDRRVIELGDVEYKVRHIQTNAAADAQAVITKLQNGAKFADLVQESQDQGSRDKGGDIGWSSPAVLPKAFGEAVKKLEIGKFTTIPVQTEFGYHVIMVDETRKTVLPPFEAKKNDLRQLLEQQALNAHIASLLKKAKVE